APVRTETQPSTTSTLLPYTTLFRSVQQSQTDYSTIWIPTGFTDLTATCHNTTGSDQPDTSSVGRLPSPAGSFLQYPPGASGDPWNLLANYDSTGQACPLTTPGQWQIKVQKNSTHFVTLNAFTVVAAARGTLVVTKNTVGGNGVFTFTTSDGPSGPPATFSISTTGNVTTGAGATTFTVAPGTYAITEIVPSSFVLLSASCSPGTSGTSATVTVAIPMGTTSGSCAFSDAASGSVVVTKSAQGGDGSFTFTLTGGPQSVTMSATINTILVTGTTTFTGLAPGLYSVSESVPGSFYPAGATQCSATVESGGTTMCTFTNDLRGSVVVTKNTVGGNGSFTFTLTGGPETVSATVTLS